MRRNLSSASLIALCSACALTLGACGDTEATVIDVDKLEAEVSDGYFEQTGQRVQSMSCPEKIDAEKGSTATCRLTTAAGNSGDIKVVVLDGDGNVRWDVVKPTRNP